MNITGTTLEKGRALTYSLGNSPRAKEQSNDVLPQAPGDSALQKASRVAL